MGDNRLTPAGVIVFLMISFALSDISSNQGEGKSNIACDATRTSSSSFSLEKGGNPTNIMYNITPTLNISTLNVYGALVKTSGAAYLEEEEERKKKKQLVIYLR